MFSIRIQIQNHATLTGLKALDWRRSRGLPDGTTVRPHYDPALISPPIPVSEGFARAHFGDTDVSPLRVVTLSQLAKGDVAEKDVLHGRSLTINPDIDPDRARELWLTGTKA